MSKSESPATSRLGWISLVLIGLIVVLLALGVVMFGMWRDQKATHDSYAEVLSAARAETQAFTTLDYRTAKKSLDRVRKGATGDFGDQFAKQSSTIEKLTLENKSVSKGKIVSAGVVSMDKDSARVVVVADSAVTNKSTQKPVPRHYRLQLDLEKKHGEWLTSSLEFVG